MGKFGWITNLMKNNRIHTAKKPYKYPDYSKSFIGQMPSSETRGSVTGGKLSERFNCGRSFRISCHLKLRKRMHTGEKPHQCLESFDERPSPVKRKRTHTGESLTSAPNVAKAFGPAPSWKYTKGHPHWSDAISVLRLQALIMIPVRVNPVERLYRCPSVGRALFLAHISGSLVYSINCQETA